MESEGVSGTSGTLAQEVVSGYATKHRGLKMDLLPTPLVTEVEHRDRTEKLKAKGVSFHSRENGESRPNGLMDYLRFFDMLPTPRANQVNDVEINNPALAERDKSNLEEDVAKIMGEELDGKGFRLSPLFTEEMMGFPSMWTTLPFLSTNGEPKA